MTDLVATYRLQLGPHLDFRRARALVPYLAELGVSHLYLSPSLQARRGSTHGYDVVDPSRISEDLGGEGEFRRLCSAGLGVILDVVPNHMAASEEENRLWRDPELRRRVFDVDPETGWHRRFFDIGELAGVRVEDPKVFADTHAKVLALVREGLVQGLRVDHPDGLADPAGYLERLRDEGVRRVWVEKILEPGEHLRDWPVEGTTGYEFARDSTALFVDASREDAFTELYAELSGERRPFAEVALEAKLEQATTTFRVEFERLRALLDRPDLERAAAALHVYRTYVEPLRGRVADADREAVAALPDGLRRVLLLEERGHDEFVVRWQQTTGAVMAKGVEDTAFYRYTRLLALNEVGGDAGRFGLPLEEFHEAGRERARRFPSHLLATTTHDTKRSGDVRARLAALAPLADEWRERVLRWRRLTGGLEDPSEDYLLWQTLVGAWPLAAERLEAYMEKALREAKRTTSWTAPSEAHEGRVKGFCRSLYENRPFLADFEPFAARVAEAGRRISLAMTLLKLTAPGVPDLYQGDELEYLALVDPDNRRPVDWERRSRALAQARAGAAPTPETMNLHLILRALDLRARRPQAFAGGYEPLDAGPDVCAFRRGDDVAVAVPLRAGGSKRLETREGGWRDLLPEFPVALLEREGRR